MSHTPEAIQAFVKQNLLPVSQIRNIALDPSLPDHNKPYLNTAKEIRRPQILICGHSSRDSRCGTMGPLLTSEFYRKGLNPWGRPGTHHMRISPDRKLISRPIFANLRRRNSRPIISTVSHIGGHAFAGNVIIYIPPRWRLSNGEKSPLAGKGIWYGRVEPKHVEGIYKETINGGKVIEELFRGGVGQGGEILRL